MFNRRGLQAEILASLAVLMATATTVLGVLLVRSNDAGGHRLHQLAARTLVDEVEISSPILKLSMPELRWWTIDAGGRITAREGHNQEIGEALLTLAERARDEGRALVQSGTPWSPLLFAAPVGNGPRVAAARLPAAISPALVAAVALGDVLIFTAFGASVLRRRLVRPLEQLAASARSIADGAVGIRVPEEGVRETIEVGEAFNDMTDALERRSGELEKAVVDLRESNRELREAREGLDRAERLTVVGRLAAGVAHEVGNPMGAMLAFIDLAKRDDGLSDQAREHLRRAGAEGLRVRAILRQLLDFSRPCRTERVPVDLLELCRESAGLLSAQRRYSGIDLIVEAEGEPLEALTDPNTVKQIVLNLLLNAGDAINEKEGQGRILLRVRSVANRTRRGDERGRSRGVEARRAADAVECIVRDDGPGISSENRPRIFDLFFTTKDPGDGTGLGLANAARFAEELGGHLDLSEDDGTPGAEFVLRLPAVSDAGASAQVRG